MRYRLEFFYDDEKKEYSADVKEKEVDYTGIYRSWSVKGKTLEELQESIEELTQWL